MRTVTDGVTVHLLGTGGWLPSDVRDTSCFAIRDGSSLLVLDAGTGIRRLIDSPICAGVNRIDILLSHFHLDHTIGLSYLDAIRGDVRKNVWGPGAWLYGEPTAAILNRLLGAPFNSAPGLFDSVSDLDPNASTIGGHPVRVRAQPRHSHPSVGFRYRDQLTYATDTAFDPGTAELADGCALLIHEAWLAGSQVSAVHSSAREAARIARTAGVTRLVLAHLDPRIELPGLLAEAQEIFPSTELGVDGVRHELDSA